MTIFISPVLLERYVLVENDASKLDVLTFYFIYQEESGNESGAILEPLELVIDAGIVQHILRSVTRLDITAKQLFLETTEFVRHLSWIRKLALMAEGLCMDTFVRDILGGLHSSTTRLHWSSGDHLTSTLSLALMEARGEVPEFAHRFRYQTTTGLQASKWLAVA